MKYAKIAVSEVTFWVDRPYDYSVPASLEDKIRPGMRVLVPFSRGNRRTEGIVLQLSDHSSYATPKAIIAVMDEEPVLTQAQIQLALWMRERFFCTVYEAVKAMQSAMVGDTQKAKDYAELLYGQALLMADLPLEDPAEFGKLVCKLMR